MSKKFNIDGSLQVTEKIVVQGDLEVKGSTQTVNQETLTIKDNFIAVNGDGTTLDTAGMAGVIAITGGENSILRNGNYKVDFNKFQVALNINVIDYPEVLEGEDWKDTYGPYAIDYHNILVSKFNNLALCSNGDTSSWNIASNPWGDKYTPKVYLTLSNSSSIVFELSKDKNGEILIQNYNNQQIFSFENQIIPQEDIDFVCSFLLHEDGTPLTRSEFYLGAKAYAAPIYDKTDDTLKIGLGSYEKDENGNITNFTFGAGQAQSIATRADDISDGALVAWDDT